MIKLRPHFLATLAAGAALLFAQPPTFAADEKPVQDPPAAKFLSQLDPQMREVVETAMASGALPLHELDVDKARKQPPASLAAMVVAKKHGLSVKPEEVGERKKIKVAGQTSDLDAVLYRPIGNKDGPALPALVYFHGGGFVIASPLVYEASARALANGANCVVISVDYRRAPEAKFPAAPEDAYAATQYIIKNGAELKIDPARVAVGGESAGGNLATEVCLLAKERGGSMPVHQLLIYPVTDWKSTRHSHQEYGLSPILPEKNLPWFAGFYFSSPAEAKLPLASPIYAKSLKGLPPATIINAKNDVLADDGTAYAAKLQSAGVPVKQEVYSGVTHEFFGMGVVVGKAKAAETFAAAQLKQAFAGGRPLKQE